METLIIDCVIEGRHPDLVKSLFQYQSHIRHISDSQNNTLLHHACLNDRDEILDHLLKYVLFTQEKSAGSSSTQIISWVNSANNEGYTSLHYAISKGNFVKPTQAIVKILTLAGCDIEFTTPLGLGPVHLAAQGDFPNLLAYFAELNMNVEAEDSKAGTPLHWAAYLGSYYTTALLCALKVKIDVQDAEGETPLHLATISGNARVGRLLLLKGANRYIRDKKGRTPMEIE
jgi:palmitoyltransferase ZDHHC13/17